MAGSSTGEASFTAATVGIEGAAAFGMEMAGIVGAATIGAADAAVFVSSGTGNPFDVGPTCPATASAPAPAVAPAPTPAPAPIPAKSLCSEEKKAALFQTLVGTKGSPIMGPARAPRYSQYSGTSNFYTLSSLIPQ